MRRFILIALLCLPASAMATDLATNRKMAKADNTEIGTLPEPKHERSTQSTPVLPEDINQPLMKMGRQIHHHWQVPPGISKTTPPPLVQVELNHDGSIAAIHILESSGNSALDHSLIDAIKAASPFQIPREHFEALHIIRFRFHPLK